MGLRDAMIKMLSKRSIENPGAPLTGAEALKIFSSTPTSAGVAVTEQTAMRFVAVFACIRILSETPASLPLHVYKRLAGGGKERTTEHPVYGVLHDMANPEMTAITLRETVQGHAAGWGNGYVYIVREDGFVRELWPLLPDKTQPMRDNGRLAYKVTLPSGEPRILNHLDVLHITGFGFDGLKGYSPIRLAKEAIGLGMAAEEFGARFFGAGTNLGGVVEHPGKLGKQAHDNLRGSLTQTYQGLGKSHLLLILEEGMKYQKFGIPPDEAQFLETRKFQTTEIARLFRIPPHMIADLERTTYSNIEHQSIDFVVHTLRPWLVRWEQAINYKLFTPRERATHFAEHLVDGLLRGDAKSRAEALATLRQNGIINADEWRAIENMNPQPDEAGKVFLVNGNMVPAGYVVGKTGEPAEPLAVRGKRSAAGRTRLAKAYRHIFYDAAERVVRREKADITKVGLKVLGERSEAGFTRWLEGFYAEAPAWIKRTVSPAINSYAEAVQAAAAAEVNASEGMTPDMEQFVSEYTDAFVARYISSSVGQLKHVVRKAIEDNEDVPEALAQRLDEWEQTRPGKVAMNETSQQGNAVARMVFMAAGVTRLRWQNVGSKTCAICAEMDGKVVGIHRAFVDAGTKLDSESQSDMEIYRPAAHPPIHQGCVCQIIPD